VAVHAHDVLIYTAVTDPPGIADASGTLPPVCISIAVIQNGVVTYAHAYGKAQLSPSKAATTSTRYAVDSISKEFTAAAVLLLVQQGKLSLDDPVEKWFPDIGDASRVTVRQLLNHTSGIRDFWPQDFVPPEMLRPTSEAAIIGEWARRPLDFESGTQWQYSNTGYVLAAAIVEKVSGEKLMDFLQQHIFGPLKMEHVTEDDTHPLPAGDAVPYTRQGLGIWPDEKTAIVAVTNSDWATPDDLLNRIAFIVLPPNAAEARARAVFSQFQQGAVDRSLFTDNGNSFLTAEAVSDLELLAIERGYPNGKLEQFLVEQLND